MIQKLLPTSLNSVEFMASSQSLYTMGWPSAEDRRFVQELNVMSSQYSSAGFGDCGMLSRVKSQRQLAFAKAALAKWPELGELKMEGNQVDHTCPFWQAGQKRYNQALERYFESLSCCKFEDSKCLLLDLGFLMIENFISEEEELDLLNYWDKDGPVFPLGTEEKRSRRRFFHYGPILGKETQGTSKSTLAVIPSQMGAMPQVVEQMELQPRLRTAAQEIHAAANTLAFDQMYVNYYDTSIDSYIDFHHDHQSCMLGTIAGVSLKSACHLQLKPLRHHISALSIELPARSLFFMSGLSRWHLQHAIPRLEETRLSLTFRSVDRSWAKAAQWQRSWEELTAGEEANAHWPLVNPQGVEQHQQDQDWCQADTKWEDSRNSRSQRVSMSYSGYSYYRPKAAWKDDGWNQSQDYARDSVKPRRWRQKSNS